jgi:hypothetical protein
MNDQHAGLTGGGETRMDHNSGDAHAHHDMADRREWRRSWTRTCVVDSGWRSFFSSNAHLDVAE